jgi:Rrf2 family protein
MKVTSQEEYAIRCLGQLARAESKVTISQIATAVGLSDENTAKIMGRLRQLELVRSIRGKEGGYVLARPPQQISVAEVIEGISGGLFELERCSSENEGQGCVYHGDCGIRPVWVTLGGIVHEFLSSISLGDILVNETDVHSHMTRLAAGLDRSRFGAARLPSLVRPS